MEDFDPKKFLLFALNHFDLKVVKHEGKMIYIEKDYVVEIEGKKLFKLMQDGQVISPFADVEEMCNFIKKDIELNEKKIELNIIALANSESSKGNFSLILEEQKGFRRLPITIGPFEAQAIAIYLEKMQPNRPLTHDLFKNTLETSGVLLTEVIISELKDGIFHAKLLGKKQDGSALEVDARSSDAIAMAVRFSCPIFTTEEIMQSAGVVLDSPSKAFTNKRGSLSEYSLDELEQLLKQVLAKEDYESASKIRDAIDKKI